MDRTQMMKNVTSWAGSCPIATLNPYRLVPMSRAHTYPDDIRERLIAAAYARLQEETPEQMALRELAASVDTSTNAIYSIFGNKNALVKEVTLIAKEQFHEAQHHDLTGPPVPALARGLRVYRQWAHNHPSLYRIIFSGNAEQGAVATLDDKAIQPLRTLLGRLAEADLLQEGTQDGQLLALWGALHGHVLLELSLWPGQGAQEDLYSEHERSLMRGLLTDAALASLA